MSHSNPASHRPENSQLLPWYRYPWPWIAIAIPAAAVAGGLFTLYLAVSNPDPLVVDEQRYQELDTELRAQPDAYLNQPARKPAQDDADGDH
jgi:hypothetical protein